MPNRRVDRMIRELLCDPVLHLFQRLASILGYPVTLARPRRAFIPASGAWTGECADDQAVQAYEVQNLSEAIAQYEVAAMEGHLRKREILGASTSREKGASPSPSGASTPRVPSPQSHHLEKPKTIVRRDHSSAKDKVGITD